MICKALDKEEITQIYHNQMLHDFAKEEIKPLKRILELWQRKQYFCYGFYEEQDNRTFLAGYCFVAAAAAGDAALVDYFAVTKEIRGCGYGSRYLSWIKEEVKRHYGNLLLEVEDPEQGKDDADRLQRRRRIAFYQKNGMTLAGIRIFLFDVEYLVMTADEKQVSLAAEQMYHIYQVLLKPKQMKTKLNISEIYGKRSTIVVN